jgi:hypothetical protein
VPSVYPIGLPGVNIVALCQKSEIRNQKSEVRS